MKYSSGNIFYKIVNERVRQGVVKISTDRLVIVRDIFPQGRFHYLFLTKRSQTHILENADVVADMMNLATRLGDVFSYGGLAKGYQVKFNGLPEGHQEVPHVHMHLILH